MKKDFTAAFGGKAAANDFTDELFDLPDLPDAPNALALRDDGSMQIGGVSFEATRLTVANDITKEEWEAIGETLLFMGKGAQWWIGDWLNYGDRVWSKTYSEVAEKTGYSAKTLREYVYVASKVDMSIRMDKLTFGHHQLVAGLPPVRQQFWLIKAADNDWSISQLRDAINPKRPPLSDNVTRFQSKLLRLKSDFIEAGEGERMQFGILLRRLADEIESGQ